MRDIDRAVIVYLPSGMRLLGFIPDALSPLKWHEDATGGTAVLHEVRELIVNRNQRVDPNTGAVVGIQVFASLLSMDISDEPLAAVQIKPASWYFLYECESMKSKAKELIKEAESREIQSRAASSGLVLPGTKNPNIPKIGGS